MVGFDVAWATTGGRLYDHRGVSLVPVDFRSVVLRLDNKNGELSWANPTRQRNQVRVLQPRIQHATVDFRNTQARNAELVLWITRLADSVHGDESCFDMCWSWNWEEQACMSELIAFWIEPWEILCCEMLVAHVPFRALSRGMHTAIVSASCTEMDSKKNHRLRRLQIFTWMQTGLERTWMQCAAKYGVKAS